MLGEGGQKEPDLQFEVFDPLVNGRGIPTPDGGVYLLRSEAFCGPLQDGPACSTTVVWASPATGIELTSCSPQSFGPYEEVSVSLTRTLSSHDSLDREECTSEEKTQKRNPVVKRAGCYSATPQ